MKYRGAVRMTWKARRGAGAWPAWEEQSPGGALFPARMVSSRLASAIGRRGEEAGMVFGCGTGRDEDGAEREAACEILAVRPMSYPGPWAGQDSTVVARVVLASEIRYGPNSFGLGRELAQRLSPVEWTYAPESVARLEVTRVEIDAPNAGREAIFPPRADVI